LVVVLEKKGALVEGKRGAYWKKLWS
jgi:hypothetical protein